MTRVQSEWILILFLAAVLAGTYGFLILATPFAISRTTTLEVNHVESVVLTINKIGSTANTMLYARVVTVDPEIGVLEVQVRDPFDSQKSPIPLRIYVKAPAYIAKQVLQGSNGVVESLSREIVGTLADISPGDTVAILTFIADDGSIMSPYILYGSPL